MLKIGREGEKRNGPVFPDANRAALWEHCAVTQRLDRWGVGLDQGSYVIKADVVSRVACSR